MCPPHSSVDSWSTTLTRPRRLWATQLFRVIRPDEKPVRILWDSTDQLAGWKKAWCAATQTCRCVRAPRPSGLAAPLCSPAVPCWVPGACPVPSVASTEKAGVSPGGAARPVGMHDWQAGRGREDAFLFGVETSAGWRKPAAARRTRSPSVPRGRRAASARAEARSAERTAHVLLQIPSAA